MSHQFTKKVNIVILASFLSFLKLFFFLIKMIILNSSCFTMQLQIIINKLCYNSIKHVFHGIFTW